MASTIYAVVWRDLGLMLSLRKPDGASAVVAAMAIHNKSKAAGVELGELRAVWLKPDDTLTTLWQPE